MNSKHIYISNRRKKIFFKYGGKCAYCGIELNPYTFEADHIVPRRYNLTHLEIKIFKIDKIKGSKSLDNLNPSCHDCNTRKMDKSLEQFLNEMKL